MGNKNILSRMNENYHNNVIFDTMNRVNIRNTKYLRYVKDFSKIPKIFGFKISVNLVTDDELNKNIKTYLKKNNRESYYDDHIIRETIIQDLIEAKINSIVKYSFLFGLDDDPSTKLYQFMAPLKYGKKLARVMKIVDTFLDNFAFHIAHRAMKLEDEKIAILESRKDYVIKEDIPNDFVTLLQENNLLFYVNEMYPLVKNKITFHKLDNDIIPVGKSKIGGRPDLPNESYWPEENGKKLGFLLQLNLEDASIYDVDHLLPEKGLLSFFYNNEDMPWGSTGKGYKVLYLDTEHLERISSFDNLDDINKFAEVKVDLSSTYSFPIDTEISFLNDDEMDDYFSFAEGKEGNETYFLGHPIEIQSDLIEENYSRYKDITKQKDDWILLMQLDSVEEAKMMWGDMGRLYFLINKHDLAKKDFTKVRLFLQCF